MKTGSSRKSKTMWLLFAAPLLVLALWFIAQKYQKSKQVIKVQLVGTMSATRASLRDLQPYQKLSQALARYPDADKFLIVWTPDNSYAHRGESDWLSYNRRDECLYEYATGGIRDAHGVLIFLTEWKNVSDHIIHKAAKAEASGVEESAPFSYKSSHQQLLENGAHIIPIKPNLS